MSFQIKKTVYKECIRTRPHLKNLCIKIRYALFQNTLGAEILVSNCVLATWVNLYYRMKNRWNEIFLKLDSWSSENINTFFLHRVMGILAMSKYFFCLISGIIVVRNLYMSSPAEFAMYCFLMGSGVQLISSRIKMSNFFTKLTTCNLCVVNHVCSL